MSIRNERIKLLATLINSMAAAAFAISIIGPLAAALYGVGESIGPSVAQMLLGFVIGLLATAALHMTARHLLGGLDNE